ncbi:MAG: alpha/beta fold hydrolase [Acidimicrobiales bacterium]
MAPLARRVLLVALSVLGAVAAPAVPAGSVDAVGAVGTDGRQTPAPAPVVAPVPGPPSSDTSSTATGDPGEHAALPPGPAISGTASSAPEPTSAAPSVTGRVTWQPCRDGDIAPDALGSAGCARVAVPLDHDRPEGATIGLALLRWPAAEPDRRLGALFVNPGGPGGSGVALARNAPALVDPEVLARYDVIGFDPRGVGASDGLSCGVADRLLAPAEPPVDPLAAQEAYGAALAAACDRERPGLLATLDTATTARDLDVVRDAIGEEQLHYLGYSYGTALGATYARLFPGHTGRMVLDGPADPAVAYVDWVAAQLVSFEAVLERFLGACEATARCPLAGKAHATWSTLLERAADEGLAVPGEAPIGRAELLDATVDVLYLGTAHHELLAGALANAAAGDAAGLAAHSRRRSGLSAAAYYGTVCGDEPTRPAAAAVAARIEQLRVEAPTFAPQLREVITCRGLDRTAAAPTSPPATAPTPPPATPAADAPAAVPAEAAVP